MFAFEDWTFNSAMLVHIHVLPVKGGERVILTFHGGEEVILNGEQAERFIVRARANKLLDPPRVDIPDIFVPNSPLNFPAGR